MGKAESVSQAYSYACLQNGLEGVRLHLKQLECQRTLGGIGLMCTSYPQLIAVESLLKRKA